MRSLSLALCLLLVATLLGACSRCGLIRDRYDAAVRQELARAGAGAVADTGLHDHVRLVVSPDALQALAEPLLQGDWLRSAAAQRLVGPRRDAVLEVELVPRVTRVDATPDGARVAARLSVELVAHARLDAVGQRQRYTTSAATAILAHLALEQASAPELLLSASDATITPPELSFDGLPEDVRDDATRMADELLTEMVREAANVVPLVRWSPLDVSGRAIPLTASSLTVSEDGALHAGFVTPTRPRGPLVPATSGPAAGARWLVHADLPRAVIEHLAVSGALPERFDDLGRADVIGDWAATASSARVGDEQASHAFRWWCLEGRRCSVDRVRVRYDIELVDGAPRLAAGELDTTDGTGRYRAWTEAARRAIEGAVTPPVVRTATRSRLEPRVLGWSVLPTALRFDVALTPGV